MSEPARELCAGELHHVLCTGLVSGYLEIAGACLPVCGPCARAFVADVLAMGFVPEIAGHVAGELRARGLPRHVVEALERRKQRLALRGA